MKIKRLTHFASIPFTALALLLALLFVVGKSTPAMASSPTDWQQMSGNSPMTHTMPMTATAPAVNAHQAHHGQAPNDDKGMQAEEHGMMDTMPMHSAGMGQQMAMMGRHLQMMGMMMQMMGHLHDMMDGMHGMMGHMPMMDGGMPMTHTMPMTDTMGAGMGMMGQDMMEMPMMEGMAPMHEMMRMMMEHMTAIMDEMKQMQHDGH